MVPKQAWFEATRDYLMRHPEEVLRAIKNLLGLRVGVPLDALRWMASRAKGKKAPSDVQIEAVPPGVRVGATLDLMGTLVRASAIICVQDVRLNPAELRFEIRLADVSLKLLQDADTPIATLLKSGALDLSRPGNLVAYMPKRPPILVEAADDRVVIDLMRHPALANQKVERIIALITPFLTVSAIRTDYEHLDVVLRPLQQGLTSAIQSVRNQL